MIDHHEHRFEGSPRGRVTLVARCPEGDISDAMRAIQAEFASVSIGSYPQLRPHTGGGAHQYLTRITAESRDADALQAVRDRLLSEVPCEVEQQAE